MLNTMFTTDVRQTLDQFRRSVDEMFENFYGHPSQAAAPNRERNWTFSPLLESAWSENALNLRAVVPGVAENDVQVSVQNNQLVIEGERKAPEGWQKNIYRQLNYGKFYTAVTLPTGASSTPVCSISTFRFPKQPSRSRSRFRTAIPKKPLRPDLREAGG